MQRNDTPRENIIEIQDLAKFYGSFKALKGISLAVRQGEFLSLLGPSGCGKTTLLRIIAGFQTANAGTLLIDGKSMQDVPPNKRPVNTVFQNYALFPHMTVADNVAFGPRRRGIQKAVIKREVEEALAMVGMEAFGTRYPRALSGGQQQRIALARAIINRPRVLLLDEPLGALDLKLRKRMQEELKRLHAQLGITFVYVTHDQEEALAMSDRIAVMREGEMIQLGSGEEIYRYPQSSYVADFIGEANLLACPVGADGALRIGAQGEPLPYTGKVAGRAILMIRPENIALGAPPDTDETVALPARIIQTTFVGQFWRIAAELEGGQPINLQVRENPHAHIGRDKGCTRIWWRTSAARVLES